MIKVILADKEPLEDAEHWSYDVRDMDEIIRNHQDGEVLAYWNGRLYEIEEQ